MENPAQVVAFWVNAGPTAWFAKSEAFDKEITTRYLDLHQAAALRRLDDWARTAEGALALLLLLDQFPRNMYRGSAHAFATDPLARSVARAALAAGHDRAVEPRLRPFFYLPFEHSEDLADQDLSLSLHQALGVETGDPDAARWAVLHRDIVLRFGRFPHRNRAFGRDTTAEEQAFLDQGGFSG